MTNEERQQVEDIAEISVRKYFDHYLTEVLPLQQKAERHIMHLSIEQHNADKNAHGGVERKFMKFVWMLLGASAVGGGSGLLLGKVLNFIV